jgi:uncharacterized protein (DUF983 family)
MNCERCGYSFPIYKFAYRQVRRCPKCGMTYEMKFPIGTGFFSIVIAVIITIFMPVEKPNFLVTASIFILAYYLVDIMIKIILIYRDRYTIEEWHK